MRGSASGRLARSAGSRRAVASDDARVALDGRRRRLAPSRSRRAGPRPRRAARTPGAGPYRNSMSALPAADRAAVAPQLQSTMRNSTRRSSASRTSSVPRPTIASREPTPSALSARRELLVLPLEDLLDRRGAPPRQHARWRRRCRCGWCGRRRARRSRRRRPARQLAAARSRTAPAGRRRRAAASCPAGRSILIGSRLSSRPSRRAAERLGRLVLLADLPARQVEAVQDAQVAGRRRSAAPPGRACWRRRSCCRRRPTSPR